MVTHSQSSWASSLNITGVERRHRYSRVLGSIPSSGISFFVFSPPSEFKGGKPNDTNNTLTGPGASGTTPTFILSHFSGLDIVGTYLSYIPNLRFTLFEF